MEGARSNVKKATEAVEKKRSMMAGKEDAKEKKSESTRREMARAMHEMDAKRAQNLRKLADKADKKLAGKRSEEGKEAEKKRTYDYYMSYMYPTPGYDDYYYYYNESYAYCDDGTSIPESWVCDYITDCSCGEDEDNCGPVDDGDFYCYDGYTIPYSWVCDGMWDCMSGEDEMCGDDDSYWCDDGTEIPADWECDGISDCMYGEDEWYCMDYGGSGDGHDPYYYPYYIRGLEDKKTDQ
ncbi:PREDICTED: sortilin-related receptor-like [Branchiostoma belcheri]|uniref:Sortilin-related receptor-like n=1 Tax=Branchiostoma belcheri TaxID=7741 RepID=A0A6P4ZLV3_BRABE|nr:PREDICTED: sortilin-related receptor-like [Branchiostoma belcheri]